MGNPKILLVKLSSLGDVLHNLPIVWDLRSQYPDAQIDWVVEEGYVNLLEPLLSTPSFRGLIALFLLVYAHGKDRFFPPRLGKHSLYLKKICKHLSLIHI